MRRLLLALALPLAACGSQPARRAGAVSDAVPIALQLQAADGVRVFGREYPASGGPAKAVVLLFHQAGSSKDEYATIAPRLAGAGYTALAIDQRSGGTLFGANETVAKLGRSDDYLAAQRDLQAAIDWGADQKLPVIVWGSSYSASLAFPLAAKNAGRIKALLAFSPGEYFVDKTLVGKAAARLTIPAYLTSSPAPGEVAAAAAIAGAMPGRLATRYVPKAGLHGSATLIVAKDPNGAETNWQPVLAFLDKVAP